MKVSNNVYRVSQRGGHWFVSFDDSTVLGFLTRQSAVEFARSEAMQAAPSRVEVVSREGVVERTWEFAAQ